MMRRALLASLVFAVACDASGPTTDGPPDARCVGGKCDDAFEYVPRLCAAVRGNGQLIFAHFSSLARITEHYGPVDGMAGGSSASITMFINESVQLNRAVYMCEADWCDDATVAARVSLLLKSLQGYTIALAGTDEAAAFRQLAPLAARVRAEGLEALVQDDPLAARDALVTILSSDDLKDLVNQELIELLTQSPDPEYHARDIINAVSKAAEFEADSDLIFVRPGVLDFAALADKFGRLASFYAGYGPAEQDAMVEFLEGCAVQSLGMNWDELQGLPFGDSTCGETFVSLVLRYREAWAAGSYHSRVDDPVGAYLPTLVATSVLTGDAATAFGVARDAYRNAQPVPIGVDFDDVKFGYWGYASDLARVGSNPNGYSDAKTARFMSLGEASWREVLSYSPAEPGLARALELDDANVSAGGWSDLHPVLVLENLGCEQVVYVTRRGDESGFARGVARLLGMSEADEAALYDLDQASAFDLSIREADGVWCTDWNEMPAFPTEQISADAYSAPLVTSSAFFDDADAPYPNRTESMTARGCVSAR